MIPETTNYVTHPDQGSRQLFKFQPITNELHGPQTNLIAPDGDSLFAATAGYCTNSSKNPALHRFIGTCSDSGLHGRAIVERTKQSPGQARFDWNCKDSRVGDWVIVVWY